jgi:hypothetical protein
LLVRQQLLSARVSHLGRMPVNKSESGLRKAQHMAETYMNRSSSCFVFPQHPTHGLLLIIRHPCRVGIRRIGIQAVGDPSTIWHSVVYGSDSWHVRLALVRAVDIASVMMSARTLELEIGAVETIIPCELAAVISCQMIVNKCEHG